MHFLDFRNTISKLLVDSPLGIRKLDYTNVKFKQRVVLFQSSDSYYHVSRSFRKRKGREIPPNGRNYFLNNYVLYNFICMSY